jgi:hypothetical protein
MRSFLRPQDTKECGELPSPHVGIDVGISGEKGRETKALPDMPVFLGIFWQGYVKACSGNPSAWLNQTQLGCPFDRRSAIIDIEFAVDTLGIGANRAQADHEFTRDLRPRKLGLQQAEHVKLTLAERLDEC